MSEYWRVARLYMVVLAIFTVGRLITGLRGVPYEKGHHIFSLVTMSLLASAFYGGFCRKWRGYTVPRAMAVGATLALLGQAVILVMTVLSYALHLDTYFVNPRAIAGADAAGPISFLAAVGSRVGGMVVNVAMCAVAAAVGWVMGATLPDAGPAA
jgi:hypothetical protein